MSYFAMIDMFWLHSIAETWEKSSGIGRLGKQYIDTSHCYKCHFFNLPKHTLLNKQGCRKCRYKIHSKQNSTPAHMLAGRVWSFLHTVLIVCVFQMTYTFPTSPNDPPLDLTATKHPSFKLYMAQLKLCCTNSHHPGSFSKSCKTKGHCFHPISSQKFALVRGSLKLICQRTYTNFSQYRPGIPIYYLSPSSPPLKYKIESFLQLLQHWYTAIKYRIHQLDEKN